MAAIKGPPTDVIDVADRTGLVRFALRARLDQHNVDGVKGREAFRLALNLSHASTSDRLNERPHEAAIECERLGLIPPDVISAFAVRQQRYSGVLYRPRVSGSWWPDIARAMNANGEGPLDCANEHELILVTEAFVAARPQVFTSNRALGVEDQLIVTQLTTALSLAICRPTLRMTECLDLLSLLVPWAVPTVLDIASTHPFGPKLVRALDRSLRNQRANVRFRDALHQFLRNPGGIGRARVLARRRYWMRAVRRVLWFDAQRRTTGSRRWATEQLAIAARRQLAYAWASESDRRYAVWVLAEFTLDNERLWQDVRSEFALDPTMVDLLDMAAEARGWLRQPSGTRDLIAFSPAEGWTVLPEARRALQRALLSERVVFGKLEGDRRGRAMALVSEALLTPCDIRKRGAVDTLLAAGPAAIEGAAAAVNQIVHDLLETPDAPVHLLERCMHLLGRLPSQRSIPTLELMLRPTTSIPLTVARDAMWSVGSICQQFPDDTIGLAAWLTHAADRFDDPAITTFAAHSLVAAGAHPSRISEARRDAVQTDCGLDIVTWADDLPLSR